MMQVIEDIPYGLVITSAMFCAVALYRFFRPRRRWRIGAADAVLAKINSIEHAGQRFGYLRKIDPFTFEEMILTALEREGHKITRNKRYTGDGGLDGRVEINGVKFLVQAKRYTSHINPKDVSKFVTLCTRHKRSGLFVHTGKTGPASKVAIRSSNVQLISGEKLLLLLDDDRVLFPTIDHHNNRKTVVA